MARRKEVKAPEIRLAEDVQAVLEHLARRFAESRDGVGADETLPSGRPVGEVIQMSHDAFCRGIGSAMGDAVTDAFATMNCVLLNGWDTLKEGDSTERHGTVGEIVAARAAGPATPRA